MSTIFVSYARSEQDRVAPLVEALSRRGWSVHWDLNVVKGGKPYRNLIADAIAEADLVLVVWTHESVTRVWVQEEAERALKANKLFPIRLDDVELPLPFGGIQTFDLLRWDGDPDDEELGKVLDQLPPVSPSSPDTEPPPPPPPWWIKDALRRLAKAHPLLIAISVGLVSAVAIAMIRPSPPPVTPPTVVATQPGTTTAASTTALTANGGAAAQGGADSGGGGHNGHLDSGGTGSSAGSPGTGGSVSKAAVPLTCCHPSGSKKQCFTSRCEDCSPKVVYRKCSP